MSEPRKSTLVTILEAVQDLHAQEQIVTRETLADVTGLKLTTIDDRLGVLVDEGDILRVQRGVFVPAVRHPPARPMSKTAMSDGTVKVEVGDEVLTLTPREDRMLANLMTGSAMQFSTIELGHHTAILASDIAGRVRKIERLMNGLES
ncbi:hypothetical protein [Ottowia thiooxydans]|uniref:hypothetical protein n=1 Tax=Ottowia thiooxydans TaxID=219182 RepID=UPI000426907B|nr:hypothetical protein [Ottowia thiooxydans]